MQSKNELAQYVNSKVVSLQKSYVYGDRRGSAATLAKLRRSIGSEPGSDPDTWDITFGGIPAKYVGGGDAASAGEKAVHTAMTLYATHQQSKTAPMHREGPSLGRAMAKLAKSRGGADASSAVKRRFDALVTAQSFEELIFHARGLIQQLRAADISLDYGRLADDFRRLQGTASADSVRRQWGRDYSYELFSSTKKSSNTNSETTENSKGVTS